MKQKVKLSSLLFILGCLSLSGCVTAGTGGTAVSGSAGGGTSIDANSSLEHCEQTLGTLAIDDGRAARWYSQFGNATQITTIEPLLRLAVQQSNCFVITSIGNMRTDSRMKRITDIQRNSGEYRAGSKQHKGQRVAADYYMEPQIVINESSLGKVASSVSGLLGDTYGLIGAGLDMKSSVVTLSLFDVRAGIQISASEGSATSTNYDAALSMFSSGIGSRLSGMTNTPAGKATVAAFVDSYNGMVRALRNYEAQDVKGGLGRGGTLTVN